MKDQIIYLLDIYGYEKREYGYVRDNPKGTSQAVTLFDKDPQEYWFTIQMFGWFSRSSQDYKIYDSANKFQGVFTHTASDDRKIYDTGLIGIDTIEQFEVLIEVFDQYKNIDE